MVNGAAFIQALPQLSIGGLLLLVFFLLIYRGPLYLERRNEERRDRAAIDDALYKRMDERVQYLEHREAECQEKLMDAVRRIAELEGYMIGAGKANQEAAGIVAIERITRAMDKGEKGEE